MSAPLHSLYPLHLTEAIREALRRWGRTMAGFDGEQALLHGVETRTSAPVQIPRGEESCECDGLRGLYPAGEGAGYAGGIVSAAVDGMRVAEAMLQSHAHGALGAEALGGTGGSGGHAGSNPRELSSERVAGWRAGGI